MNNKKAEWLMVQLMKLVNSICHVQKYISVLVAENRYFGKIKTKCTFGKIQGRIQGGGGPGGPGPPLTTKNEAPAPKFYKTEAPEWQF